MIASFSLGTRRLVAAGLALVVILLVVQWIIVPTIVTIGEWRDELGLIEAREARLLAARSWPERPAGIVSVDNWLVYGGEEEARTRLADHVKTIATAQGLAEPRVGVSMDERTNGLAYIVTLSASGPHDAILQLISGIERGTPLMRVRSLSLVSVPARDGELALELELDAVGRRP